MTRDEWKKVIAACGSLGAFLGFLALVIAADIYFGGQRNDSHEAEGYVRGWNALALEAQSVDAAEIPDTREDGCYVVRWNHCPFPPATDGRRR